MVPQSTDSMASTINTNSTTNNTNNNNNIIIINNNNNNNASASSFYPPPTDSPSKSITPTTIIHSKKTTIHVSNIQLNRAQLRNHFREYDGFRRISFHQDYVFVCFGDVVTAATAITKIHTETDMNAAYAKHGVASNSTPTIQVAPNPILYVSIFPCFGENELLEIFSSYEGFDSCRFFPMHALVRFVSLETAKKALEDLNMTTNLFANYSTKSTKSVGENKARLQSRLAQDPLNGDGQSKVVSQSQLLQQSIMIPASNASTSKCTIHVTNLDKDIPSLLRFFKSLTGFSRVAFYIDYAFVIFSDSDTASAAIETILFGSRMKANFARSDYTPHIVPASALGIPSSLVRISDYPSTTTEEDLRKLLETFNGVTGLTVFHSNALVTFESVDAATAMVEELNGCTNLTCVFGKRKVNTAGPLNLVGANPMLQQAQQPPSASSQLPQRGFHLDDSHSANAEYSALLENNGMSPISSDTFVTDFTQGQQMAPGVVTHRGSTSTLGSNESDSDRRLMAQQVYSRITKANTLPPPGFGQYGSPNMFVNGMGQMQPHQHQQVLHGGYGNIGLGNNSLLQPRASSFPVPLSANFSNNVGGSLSGLSLYGNNELFSLSPQQPLPHQQPQRQPSSHGLYSAAFGQQQHGVPRDDYGPVQEDPSSFMRNPTGTPPPGIFPRPATKKQPSMKLPGTLNTPPSTPFSRTASPFGGTGAFSATTSTASISGLDNVLKLSQIDPDASVIRRMSSGTTGPVSAGVLGSTAGMKQEPFSTQESMNGSETQAMDRSAIVRDFLVRSDGLPAGGKGDTTVGDDTDSDETSVAVDPHHVDWKASFENAVDDVVKLRAALACQRQEFERFQAMHKNCGYLQGLLNICD